MNLSYTNLTFPIVHFFLLLLLLQICRTIIKRTSSNTRKKLPPGPCKFPIIGNLHHFLGSSLPHHTVSALAKKYGPIMHLQLGEVSTVVISSAQLAKEVLKINEPAVLNRPELLATKIVLYNNGDLVFAPYGNMWKQMHKICNLELLSAKKVKSFRLIRVDEVSRVIESIRSTSGSPIDLSRKIYWMQNIIACRAVFGGKCKDQDEVISIILEMVAYLGGLDAANLFPSFKLLPILNGMMSKLKNTRRKLDRILNDIIDEHRENIGKIKEDEEDLVDVLLRISETDLESPLTLDNIKALTTDMFAAGTQNTATTIEWAMAEMLRNPRVLEKAQAELREIFKGKKVMDETDLQQCSYLKMVIKETLRLRNPFPFLPLRQSREQFDIEGYTIPVNTNIMVNFSTIVRDPEYWHNAESFLPERFENSSADFKGNNFEYIPFGAGRRICPGISFSMASIELVLAQLLYHFDWKMPYGMEPRDLDMTELFGINVCKKNSLSLIATPYSSP